jgi:hypothetical protein
MPVVKHKFIQPVPTSSSLFQILRLDSYHCSRVARRDSHRLRKDPFFEAIQKLFLFNGATHIFVKKILDLK